LEALRAGNLDFENCGDVYSGLAVLCREASADDVVIVHADRLTAAEMEFFALVKKTRLARAVYVYASEYRLPRADAAVAAGATGVLTAEVVERLISEIRDAGAVRPATESPGLRVRADEEPEESPASEEQVEETDEPDVSVRVPWRQYDDAPQRSRPPSGNADMTPSGESDRTEGRREPSRLQPLLTEEELRALLGEDFFDTTTHGG
jgi:hypothetical protein